MKNVKVKNILFFLGLLLLNISSAFAISNNILLDNIEKSLIFSKDEVQKIKFHNQNSEGVLEINRAKPQISDISPKNSKLDVKVVNVDNFEHEIKEKENIAYNAALIGQYEVAIQLYKDILKDDPKNSYVKFSLAVAYQNLNQYSQAKTIYNELLSANPDNKQDIISNLLSILVDESPKEAVYFLTRLATQNQSSPYIMAQLALA